MSKKLGILVVIFLLFIFTISHTIYVLDLKKDISRTLYVFNVIVVLGYIISMLLWSLLYLKTDDCD